MILVVLGIPSLWQPVFTYNMVFRTDLCVPDKMLSILSMVKELHHTSDGLFIHICLLCAFPTLHSMAN